MRTATRRFILIAGILLLLLLAGVSGWLSRHHWIPPLVSGQLDGVTLTEIRGFTLAREKHQISAHIAYLALHTDEGLHIGIENLQLTQLHAFLSKLRASVPAPTPQSQLQIARLELHSTRPQAGDTRKPTAPDLGTHSSSQPASPKSPKSPTGDIAAESEISISNTLRALENFPLRAANIQRLYWTERFDGYLALSLLNSQHTPGAESRITGEVTSSQCPDDCTILWQFEETEKDRPKLSLSLQYSDSPVAETEIVLDPADTNLAGGQRWALQGRIRISPQQAGPLTERLGLNLTGAPNKSAPLDWTALVQSMTGPVELGLTGELPDTIRGSADLHNLRGALVASTFSATLPREIAGAPLVVEYSANAPLVLGIATLSPLALDTVHGTFTLRIEVEQAAQPAKTALDTPLLETEIELSTDRQIPSVAFRGHYNMDQLAPLIASTKWQSAFGHYRVSDVSGQYRFSGRTSLPSLERLANSQSGPKTTTILNDFSMQVTAGEPIAFRLALPPQDNPLEALGWKSIAVQIQAQQPLTIDADKIPGSMRAKIPRLEFETNASGASPEHTSLLAGELVDTQCTNLAPLDCTFSLTAQLSNLDFADAASALQNLTLETAGAISLAHTTEGAQVTLTNLNLTAKSLSSGPVVIANPEMFSQQAGCTLKPQLTHCSSPQLALNIAPLRLAENQIEGAVFLRDVVLNNKAGKKHGLKIRADYQGDDLKIQALDQFQTRIGTSGNIALSDGRVSGNGTVSTGPLEMTTTWTHRLETGQGKLQLALPETAFSPNNSLDRAITGLPVNIVGGVLSGGAQLIWPDQGLGKARLTMQDTGLQLNKSFALGVNTEITLQQSDGEWITAQPAPVSIDTVDAGVALKNLHFSLALQHGGELVLKNFAAELLEGALTSEALRWSLSGEERRSELQFTGVSIRALAREMESENFAASGLLDARIPLVTDQQGITVENGTVQSRPPGGRLRYYGAFSPAMLGSNPQLKLLAGALEDYNYRDINGTINYPLSGDLLLNLKLTGRSDAIDANRDLIINLNLENNIPTMLRSLQASRDLTDVLEQGVR
ncbi:YdbH domain-containing protein [Microbulbifer sp. Q7]|uniref:intermembrane phospholipid transport protein YdbH family protein n=1 Tax=Microbulbifer sp. Q7 TaxID=1785091 RepID=UPI00082C6A23|nr:YdbH domain-containing protein [Microbulbifer sp. Q7]